MNQTKTEKGINIALVLCEMKEANIHKKKALMETKKGRRCGEGEDGKREEKGKGRRWRDGDEGKERLKRRIKMNMMMKNRKKVKAKKKFVK